MSYAHFSGGETEPEGVLVPPRPLDCSLSLNPGRGAPHGGTQGSVVRSYMKSAGA